MPHFKTRKPQAFMGSALVAAFALSACATLAHAQDTTDHGTAPANSWQTGLERTDLVKRDLGDKNTEIIQVRVDFAPGVAAPKHSHPGVEVAYVINGTFEYQLDGQPTVTLKSGDSLYIPPGVAHVAKNVGTTKGSELATYVVDKGKPLVHLEN
jgi:quercetin dioxygenase-like cupin family protein